MNEQKRLLSLDALRGFDMLFIMGLSPLIVSICALFPGGGECWLAETMGHARWDGFTHHDTIFPLFLFIAGVSFPFSLARQLKSGLGKGRIYARLFRRAAALILLGIVYNGLFDLDFANLRIASVLGRIGTAWLLAAILYVNFGTRTRAAIAAVILIGYWLLLRFVPAPDVQGAAGPFSFEGNLAGYVDRMLLPGKIYSGTFDPEGLLSTLPAIVTAMLGMFTGELVRRPEDKMPGTRKTAVMLAAAAVLLIAGMVWNEFFPINKKLWSSSFVCVAGAYSLFMFALFYYVIDVKGLRNWTLFFRVVGLNSITIYLAQEIIDFKGIGNFFLGGAERLCGQPWDAVIGSAGYVAVCWLFLYFLYRQKIFLKI